MSNVVTLANKRDWKWHRKHIAEAWGTQIESIIETGRRLTIAQDEIGHGSYEAMVRTRLPFSLETARQLKAIAAHQIISNPQHAGDLPVTWTTLFELTKVPNNILLAGLRDGTIHPKLERKDAIAMNPKAKTKPKAVSREQLIAAIQKDPMANHRDAAAELGVSLGTYQRTRNELIGSGEINGALTFDDLRERLVERLRDASKEQRMHEVTAIIRALGLNIRDWVTTMTIGKTKG